MNEEKRLRNHSGVKSVKSCKESLKFSNGFQYKDMSSKPSSWLGGFARLLTFRDQWQAPLKGPR
jgi:hypothetical protein